MSVGGDADDLGGCMEDEVEAAAGHLKGANVASEEGDGGVVCEVRSPVRKGCGIPRENHSRDVQSKSAINMQQRAQDPRTEEAGASGDEETLIAHLIP
jgi:hypothetical protein